MSFVENFAKRPKRLVNSFIQDIKIQIYAAVCWYYTVHGVLNKGFFLQILDLILWWIENEDCGESKMKKSELWPI